MIETGKLIAIDPGRNTGFAVFVDGVLEHVALIHVRPLHLHLIDCLRRCDHLAIEIPKIYPRSSATPDSIITLAVTAGILIGSVEHRAITRLAPRQWKGTAPKRIHNPRTLKRLSMYEQQVAHLRLKDHNVLDAIGIGLHMLRRDRP